MALLPVVHARPTKASFEDDIDRHAANGTVLIWPEGTDPEAVKAWRESGSTISDRKASLRPKGGSYYSRTTTFIDCLDDKEGLTRWKMRQVLLGAHVKPDLVSKVTEIEDPQTPDGRRALDRLAEKALDAANAHYKREVGTALHELLEEYDAGQDLGFVPPRYEAAVQEYLKHTEVFDMVAIERFGVNDEYKVGGTLDRLVIHDGRLRVADLKTGSITAGKLAMQLGFYAHMQEYNPATFERTPYTHNGLEVDQEVGILIHMPSDQDYCDIYEVDIASGWKRVDLAARVRADRNLWKTKAYQPTLIGGTNFGAVA